MPELPSNNDSSVEKPLTASDLEDIFNKPDDAAKPEVDKAKPEKESKEVKEDKEDKKLDEEEIEIKGLDDEDEDENEKLDLDEDDEDKDENDEADKELNAKDEDDIEIAAPPKLKELEAFAPGIGKKFPFLEKMMFRDKKVTELFGSFDNVKEAAVRLEALNHFESDLFNGETGDILKVVKERDQKAYDKIVDNYLPTLYKIDKDAYFEVVGNMGKKIIMEIVSEAKANSDDDLKELAIGLNKFLFNTSQFTPPKNRVDEKEESKTSEVDAERQKFMQERFTTAQTDLKSRVDKLLKATIADYIDPKDSMPPYVKKKAIEDALTQTHKVLGNDPALRRNIDSLWKAAFDAKFNPESVSKIQSAYLGGARRSLRTVIKKIRAEVLKDLPPRGKKNDEEETTSRRSRGNINAGRPAQQRQDGGKLEMRKGESIADFLARD